MTFNKVPFALSKSFRIMRLSLLLASMNGILSNGLIRMSTGCFLDLT